MKSCESFGEIPERTRANVWLCERHSEGHAFDLRGYHRAGRLINQNDVRRDALLRGQSLGREHLGKATSARRVQAEEKFTRVGRDPIDARGGKAGCDGGNRFDGAKTRDGKKAFRISHASNLVSDPL